MHPNDPANYDDARNEAEMKERLRVLVDLSDIEAAVAHDVEYGFTALEDDAVFGSDPRLLWAIGRLLESPTGQLTSAELAIAHGAVYDWLRDSPGVARYVDAQRKAALLGGPP